MYAQKHKLLVGGTDDNPLLKFFYIGVFQLLTLVTHTTTTCMNFNRSGLLTSLAARTSANSVHTHIKDVAPCPLSASHVRTRTSTSSRANFFLQHEKLS